MCCLYYIDEAVEKDIERLVNDIDKNIKLKTGDIHPTDQAPVICKRNQDLYATSMKWGFMGRDQKPLINARAESALEKPTFSDSVMHRRCIIPAGKFYEWNRDKQKVTFRYRESPSIYMAGFYRMDGNEPRFVILTTAANFPDAIVRSIHSFKDSMESDIFSKWFLIFRNSGISSCVISPSAAMSIKRSFSLDSVFKVESISRVITESSFAATSGTYSCPNGHSWEQ